MRACAAILVVAFLACGSLTPAAAAPPGAATAPSDAAAAGRPAVVLYLARRSWHIDVGFAVRDLGPSLAFIARRFPRAQFLFFGFGDRHYLLSGGKGTSTLSGALFPGPGVILVTALEGPPGRAFGNPHVLEFAVSETQAHAAQSFIRSSLSSGGGAGARDASGGARTDEARTDETFTDIVPLAKGPYEGSLYYAAAVAYSALHTCNTWAAEALAAAGLEIRPRHVLFASQLWRRARRILRHPAGSPEREGVLAPGI